ncbi:Asp-tRNA(Asn)/Glu-tRNA(Gln) amidotransferase A subunit family amidase [Bradyrhizobium sp. LM3.6]
MAKPDRRDGMSLPAEPLNWKGLEKSPRKLRIGLMLDPGVGQALEKPVREVAVKAAKAFESAGAVVTEVDGILTREMLDGLDNFWRARMWDDLSKLTPAEQAKVLPYIFKWGESGAKLSGVDVIRGFNQTMAIRAAASKLFCELDYVISPTAPNVNVSGGMGLADQRSHEAVRAHRLYRAVEYVGESGDLHQRRL